MAARSTKHQELQPGPSRNHDISPEKEDGTADENINPGIVEVDYEPLYLAASEGNWESASMFFEKDTNAFTATNTSSMTALHVAAYKRQTVFVEKMLLDKRLPPEVLAIRDRDGLTPLHYAARAGNFRMAKALVTKNSSLTQIADNKGYTPLLTACDRAPKYRELLWYLATKTKDDPPASPFTGKMGCRLISCLDRAGFYDIMQHLLGLHPKLITAVGSNHANTRSLIRAMVEEPSNFESGHTFSIWERWIYQIVPPAEPNATVSRPLKGDIEERPQNSYAEKPVWRRTYVSQVLRCLKMSSWKVIENLVPFIRRIRNTKSRHKLAIDLVETVCAQVSKKSSVEMYQYFNDSITQDILLTAVANGVDEILRVCLKCFPDLIWLPVKKRTLMVHAVIHRQEKIFNLLCERSTNLSNREANGNNNIEATYHILGATFDMLTAENVLNQAAELSPRLTSVSGAALRMQREVQWFKAVESILYPSFKRERFDEGNTAWQKFQEKHKDLLKEGQEWMKNTSNSCMLVATLIATVVFTAVFTVPGGNVSDKGIPIFLTETSFLVFVVSDALALFSSITSILMFLPVLTSRYAEEDFLEALPRRLIIGLACLFFAIATMMVAFGATISIMLRETRKWLPIVLLALVPVILFLKLQLRLFIEMCRSTYGKVIFHLKMPYS